MTKQNNGWISVDEALPEFQGYYLVFCPYWANSVCSVEFNLDLGDFLECADEITHWQPLPQPPEDKEPQAESTSHEKKTDPIDSGSVYSPMHDFILE